MVAALAPLIAFIVKGISKNTVVIARERSDRSNLSIKKRKTRLLRQRTARNDNYF